MAEKPGWYPDPEDRPKVYRWWTGVGWTRWLSDSPDAAPPEGHDNPRITAVVVPHGDRQVSMAARTIVVAVVLILVVLVAAAVGGAVTNQARPHPDAGETPSNYTAAPPQLDTELVYDEATRVASFGDVSVTLPMGEMHQFGITRTIDPMVATSVPVSQPSGATGWVAQVAFGRYAGGVQTDLDAYAEQVLAQLAHRSFGDVVAEIHDVRHGELGDLPAERAVSVQSRMTYPAPEGDAQADLVEVVIVQVNEVEYVVWVSMVPENASAEVLDGVAESRESLRVN